MDVMRPEVRWIDGCCFRINVVNPLSQQEERTFEAPKTYQEYDDEPDCTYNPCVDDVQIICDDSGKYTASLHVASAFFPIIIGSKGSTKKRLEAETRTQISIPKMGHEGDIKIKGMDQKGIAAACRRIGLIVMSSRQRQPFTHFVSLSVAGDEIKKSFITFKKEVLEECGSSRGISESIFQNELKLHLTLGTLVLLDKVERDMASKALQLAHSEVVMPMLEGKTLKIVMKGLEYMNDDPAEVDVLYGKVQVVGEDEGILQKLSDEIVGYFQRIGLMQKEYERVKLHVTLLNTIFRREDPKKNMTEEESAWASQTRKEREAFDATSILEKFQGYYFGEHIIDSIHLSQRYSTGKNGYYQSTAVVKLL